MNSKEIVQPDLFPFPLPVHLVFACLALFFFIILYLRDRKTYQLIFTFAMPLSLVIWITNNRTFFYFVGIVELALIIIALVTAILDKIKKKNQASETETTGENTEATDSAIADNAVITEETDSPTEE